MFHEACASSNGSEVIVERWWYSCFLKFLQLLFFVCEFICSSYSLSVNLFAALIFCPWYSCDIREFLQEEEVLAVILVNLFDAPWDCKTQKLYIYLNDIHQCQRTKYLPKYQTLILSLWSWLTYNIEKFSSSNKSQTIEPTMFYNYTFYSRFNFVLVLKLPKYNFTTWKYSSWPFGSSS